MTKIYETYSKVNGQLEVHKELIWGVSVKSGGLIQSGDLIEKIWKKPLAVVENSEKNINKVLILGLGAGSTAKLARKKFTNAKIIGVDLDPIMVEIGEKYFGLGNLDVEIIISDALEYAKKADSTFDLILIDLYQGREIPKQFNSEDFILSVKDNLTNNGYALFNRLYGGVDRPGAMQFLAKLEKSFDQVDPVYPLANVIFVCRD